MTVVEILLVVAGFVYGFPVGMLVAHFIMKRARK